MTAKCPGPVGLLACLAFACCARAADRPFPWPVPDKAGQYLGDPARGAEQKEQYRRSHVLTQTKIAWPINQGNPFVDWGHFRLNRSAAGGGRDGHRLVMPGPDGKDSREQIRRLNAMYETKDWKDGKLLRYSILLPDPKATRPRDGWPLVINCPGLGGVGRQGLRGDRFSNDTRWATDYYRTNTPAVVVTLHPQQRTHDYVETEVRHRA